MAERQQWTQTLTSESVKALMSSENASEGWQYWPNDQSLGVSERHHKAVQTGQNGQPKLKSYLRPDTSSWATTGDSRADPTGNPDRTSRTGVVVSTAWQPWGSQTSDEHSAFGSNRANWSAVASLAHLGHWSHPHPLSRSPPSIPKCNCMLGCILSKHKNRCM